MEKLRVLPRNTAFRYKGREADAQGVGRELNVRAVLTGRVLQRGEALIVSAELMDVVQESQLWGGRFNRRLDDIFEVQKEVASQISEKLRLRLTPEEKKRLTKQPTENREAYQLLLKAHYYTNKWTPEGISQGMAYARQAIEADPGYAAAYAWIAFTYAYLAAFGSVPPSEAAPKAKAAALRALEIDESLADSHTALGTVQAFYERDWSGAGRSLKRALELNPNYAWAHYWYGFWLFLFSHLRFSPPATVRLLFSAGLRQQPTEVLRSAFLTGSDSSWRFSLRLMVHHIHAGGTCTRYYRTADPNRTARWAPGADF